MRLTITVEVDERGNLGLALRDAFLIARRMPDMDADLWRLRDPAGKYRGFVVVEAGHKVVTEPPEMRRS